MPDKTITVIGNYSGRNAGDAAILGNLLRDISERHPDTHFLIPTIRPAFILKEYSNYNVSPISLMPWNLSLKIFGVPIITSVTRTDLVLITDAIMFDRKLINPIHNYLSTLSLVIPLAKRRGIPVVLYNVSIGPIFTRLGRICLKRVIENSDLLISRDKDSLTVLKDLEIYPPQIRQGADCALGTEKCSEERLEEILKKENLFRNGRPAIGFNINSYIDIYVKKYKKGISRQRFISIISGVVERVIEEFKVDVVFVVTQIMDISITKEAINTINPSKRRFVSFISNRDYTYQELATVMSLFEMFVGMRTHSVILSSSMGTPVIGIIAYPKTRGFLESIGQKERMIEFRDFDMDRLFNLISSMWEDRFRIKKELINFISKEKLKAKRSAEFLSPFLSP